MFTNQLRPILMVTQVKQASSPFAVGSLLLLRAARWGNLGSAKADAQRAMDIDPQHIKAYFRRAAAYKQVSGSESHESHRPGGWPVTGLPLESEEGGRRRLSG